MTVSVISSNTTGVGAGFAFTSNGNALVVMQGVTLGSTGSAAFSCGSFTDLEVTVLGSLFSASLITMNAASSLTIATGASFASFVIGSTSAALFLNGTDSLVQIDGSLIASESIGILSPGGNQVQVTGTVSGASAVFLGLFGGINDVLVNSGHISASSVDDLIRDQRYNNGVFAEGANTRITNLAEGVITAVSSEGAAVRLGAGGDGSTVTNFGTLTAVTWYGVDFEKMGAAESATLYNSGVISGRMGSFIGNEAQDQVVNSGRMVGKVLLGDGADVFNGRFGQVEGSIFGGAGDDLIDLRDGAITGSLTGDAGADTLRGTASEDSLFGGTEGDYLSGKADDDSLDGGSGADTLLGGAGDDSLFGGSEADLLTGGNGDDLLLGGSGADVMQGGSGDDTLNGNYNADTFVGGGGADVFQFDKASDIGLFAAAHDKVVDFVSGTDRIDLSGIDANTLAAGDQAFTYVGTGAFTNGVRGQLRYTAATGVLEGDYNGDAVADFAIEITNHPAALGLADLIL